MDKREHHKIVLLGDSSVGKSSIVNRYVNHRFFEYNESTIGAAFFSKHVICGERNIILDIWDTAGQERYNSLLPMYYRGAKAAIIVYDITCRASFDKAKQWLEDISRILTDTIILFVGNKSDLHEQSIITKDLLSDINSYPNTFNIEVSAKNNHNIDKLFQYIIDNIKPPVVSDEDFNRSLRPSFLLDPQQKFNNNDCKCS